MVAMLTDEDVKKNLSVNLRRLMRARGIRQTQIAETCGMTQPSVSRIVQGDYVPNVTTIARLAEALDTTVDFLLREFREENPPSDS